MKLPSTIEECHEMILTQGKIIQSLMEKILELERRLNQNSGNSHRPPSSEGYKKKPALSKKKGGKQGGQKGHKGKTLEMVATPDHVEELRPHQCICGQSLEGVALELSSRRQVFDLPAPKLEVTEYQLYSGRCPCCQVKVEGQFPDQVKAPVQYGARVKALAGLLNNGHHLSFQSIKEVFADIYGYELNEATIQSANQNLSDQLQQSEAQLKHLVSESQVVHLDETGLRVQGKLQWLHVACSKDLTYLFVHQNRGKQALESEASILPYFMGTAIHDRWSSYFHYLLCFHGLCGAHLLRDLTALIESGSKWASQMHQLLLDLYEASDQGRSKVDNIKPWQRKYDRICRQAKREEPPPKKNLHGRPSKSRGLNLVEQLIQYRLYVLAFAQYEEIPFTNNLAERDLRPAKIKQKVAGCFRTIEGAQRFARIRSFISTARKQSRNVFTELVQALSGNSFILNLSAQST